MLATFIARAVIDEVLPPSFVADPVVANLGGDVVNYAKVMLSRDHAGAKLERIWGPGDGRPVDAMKEAVDQLLLEYLVSHQVEEAARCVKQLNAPLFHHELVKRLLVIALEKSADDRQHLSTLLQYLMEEDIVSQKQFVKGFDRTFSILSDLVLDTPNAQTLVKEFADRAIADCVLPKSYSFPH
jgi:programmed cell death protein 4